jgi:hypothetical protein
LLAELQLAAHIPLEEGTLGAGNLVVGIPGAGNLAVHQVEHSLDVAGILFVLEVVGSLQAVEVGLVLMGQTKHTPVT